MIIKSQIEKTLDELEKSYNSASNLKNKNFYAKLAVIEVCAWIEETVDDILLKHSKRKLLMLKNKEFYKNEVGNCYGFSYDKNIRPIFLTLVGIIDVEKIEKKLEKNKHLTLLSSSLGTLAVIRNKAAHTYVKNTTMTYTSPAIIKNNYKNIITALIEFDSILRSK